MGAIITHQDGSRMGWMGWMAFGCQEQQGWGRGCSSTDSWRAWRPRGACWLSNGQSPAEGCISSGPPAAPEASEGPPARERRGGGGGVNWRQSTGNFAPESRSLGGGRAPSPHLAFAGKVLLPGSSSAAGKPGGTEVAHPPAVRGSLPKVHRQDGSAAPVLWAAA